MLDSYLRKGTVTFLLSSVEQALPFIAFLFHSYGMLPVWIKNIQMNKNE
jgi:hypothetical protein